ncbi:MAG: gamma carbonic anhydrase family protein [Desulfarculus sp.]|jgi:carbonic anhydrase/acetyltransferase-like protein (isoleucine patch superfamily)|nr:MAG: gamma carbonic anhydrase family protein [Desulfarculus sp.]
MPQAYGPEVTLHNPAFIHPAALIYGKVTIEEGASLWACSVIRAETHEVRIGRYTNIQDMVMIHIALGHPVIVGEYCSVAHHTTLHGCEIGDNCLIGINCTIMDGCRVGDNSIVAGGTFLTQNTVIPPNSIVMGTPGKVARQKNNFEFNRHNALIYHRNALAYARGEHRAWSGPEFQEFEDREKQKIGEEFARLAPPPGQA